MGFPIKAPFSIDKIINKLQLPNVQFVKLVFHAGVKVCISNSQASHTNK